MDGRISSQYCKFGEAKGASFMKKILITVGTLSVVSLLIFFNSCSSVDTFDNEYYPLQKLIIIPEITSVQHEKINRNVESEFTTVNEENGLNVAGYKTKNKIFLEEVIAPLVNPHLSEISKMSKSEMINFFTLFNFEIYQRYFGKNFYRWGGDILDLDDPQERGSRSKFAYGLDCSGFIASPFELAIYFGLMKEDEALFSSKGYQNYCSVNEKHDIGGREGTSNNFRLDTPELAELGREVFKLEKGQIPTEEQIKKLQPGDIVGRSGHFGIIAELNGNAYYLESGGSVVPKNEGIPVKAVDALRVFASRGAITVRRCMEDTK
jgi:hypothetical protein